MRKTMVTTAVVALVALAACGGDDRELRVTEPGEAGAPTTTVEEAVAGAVAEAATLVRPMPCAADEVYVWVDYDAGTAQCVAGDDHARHAGH